METIVRENDPIDLGDEVVKCKIPICNRIITYLLLIDIMLSPIGGNYLEAIFYSRQGR